MSPISSRDRRWWGLLCAIPLIAFAGWAWDHIHPSPGLVPLSDPIGLLQALGRLSGLLAALALLLQLLLSSRLRWLERSFGLDRLTRLHHIVGFSLATLLLAHPALLIAAAARKNGTGMGETLVRLIGELQGVGAAVVGLVLIALTLMGSVLVLQRRLHYERWHALHLILYPALVLVFFHPPAIGFDLIHNRNLAVYAYALCAATLGAVIVERLARPLQWFTRHRFRVLRVRPESEDATSVEIGGRDLERFPARAGQFVIVRFLAPGFRFEAHPFSLSRLPDAHGLRITIRHVGDFTRRIPALPPGTRVMVEGPYGCFTSEHRALQKGLLIAGGIGITPLRALAGEWVAEGRDTLLLYANRHPRFAVFTGELEALAATSDGRFRMIPIMSDAPDWPGERGRIDRDRLSRLVPDLHEREVYLCGPPAMMRSVRDALSGLGVPQSRLHDERFAL